MEPALEEDFEGRRPASRARKLAVAIAVLIAVASTATWAYTKYVMQHAPLGGPCSWSIECSADANRCMRPSVDETGVCSHPCDAGVECTPDIACVEVELDEERDARGVPAKGGYCFPRAFLEQVKHRKKGGK